MSTVERRPRHVGLRRKRRLRAGKGHGVVMVLLDRREARRGGANLALLLFPALGSSHDLRCSALVRRVIEERADVVNEERVQHLRDLLLVGKVQSTLVGDPVPS